MTSSLIFKIEYDPKTRVLSVWLHNEPAPYRYADVPPDIAAEFQRAASQGVYFNARIKAFYQQI